MSSPSPDSQSLFTILCQGTRADGDPFWAYVEMKPTRIKQFRQAQADGIVLDLEELGRIVEWGIGPEVPADTRERMEREHGVNHAFETDLEREVKKRKKKNG